MILLGIETSCDETSVALIENGRTVLSHMIATQIPLHKRFFGVVPEIASRAHLQVINGMVETVMKKSKPARALDAVAVTYGPGLVGSLIVGYMTAEIISYCLKIPMIEVNHLEGHLLSPFIGRQLPRKSFLSLIVSGGHTDLVYVKKPGVYEFLGRTRDDACGEAYDKVARILGLGYPGGPVIDRIYPTADPHRYALPRVVMQGSLDFSFSGLKTAVMYTCRSLCGPSCAKPELLPKQVRYDLAASFQESAVEILISKTLRAARKTGVTTIALGGGVSANTLLRKRLTERARKEGITVCVPPLEYCTDNAAMIAHAGYYKMRHASRLPGGIRPTLTKGVQSSACLENW